MNFAKYYTPILILILAFAFFTRVYRLSEPKLYIFDEVYHAVTAKLISRNDVRAYEWWNPPVEVNTAVDWLHPPLAKYTQAFFILIFGENTFGWRISAALFGVLVIAATAALARELFDDPLLSLLAALLASFDGLLLTQSRIAMNDIHVTFWILMALIYYVRYRKTHQPLSNLEATKIKPSSKLKIPAQALASDRLLVITGLCTGLAMGSKWSGLFVFFFLLANEGLRFLTNLKSDLNHLPPIKVLPTYFDQAVKHFAILVVLPFFIYVASYTHMFLQGKTLFCFENRQIEGQCYYETFSWGKHTLYQGYVSHFTELHRQIWWYQTNLTATHPFQSRPWQWFLDLRPVWFHVEYSNAGKIANIYAQANPLLAWIGVGAVFLSIAYLASTTGRPTSLLFALSAYLIVWLPWEFSPRIMFFYHYTPAIPLLSILVAYWVARLIQPWDKTSWWRKILGGTIVGLVGITFVIFYPNWTGISVSQTFANTFYFALSSWK